MPPAPPRMATAAVYEAPNTPFVLKQFPLRPVRRDEVLVRVSMSTICRSDIHSYEGRRPNPCPGILGHEIIGVIAAIGEDIERDMRGDSLKIGDRITWSEYFFEGRHAAEVPGLAQVRTRSCGGGSAFPRRLRRVLLHFARHLDPQASARSKRRGGNAAQLRCRTMAAVTEAAAISLGDNVVIQGLGLRALRRGDGQGARSALCHRSRRRPVPTEGRQQIRRRSCHRYLVWRRAIRRDADQDRSARLMAPTPSSRFAEYQRSFDKACRCCGSAGAMCSPVWSIPTPM